jgi:FkbM family methyltransferase
MSGLNLLFADGAQLTVPETLRCITTYVLLEQEAWFEKECGFVSAWLRPAMNVIDIGANLGVYAIPAARRAGPDGLVYAYEPGAEARGFLARSRAANGLANLEIVPFALSDAPREGRLFHGPSGELHTLSGRGEGEAVSVTSLDSEAERLGWGAIEFVKIDAEGEEMRILKGGANFFSAQSPLVMFEIKAGKIVNLELLSAFAALGYRIYRLIAGAPLLVPFDPGQPVDTYELNLFAAKPDRAGALAKEGFLIDTIREWQPDAKARREATAALKALPFAAGVPKNFFDLSTLNPAYRDCLAGLDVWHSRDASWDVRYAALRYAERALHALCGKEPSLARLSTAARASWDSGERLRAVTALYRFAEMLSRRNANLNEPFWPANPRFDRIDPKGRMQDWFLGGTMEQLVFAERFSSLYGPPPIDLRQFEQNVFASPAIARRRVLAALRAGQDVSIPEVLRHNGEGHRNGEIWRRGKVPGR